MNLKAFFKKDYIIGLDIGSSSVKMAQFQSREDGLHLVRAELKEIVYTDDEETREKETLSALKYLLKGVDVKRSKIVAAINCPQTAVKKIVTPYMPKSELQQGIGLQAKNYFPFSIEDCLIDFEIINDIVEKGIRKYEVIVAVSPRKTVDRYLSLLQKAGIRPSALVPYPYVFKRLAGQFRFKEDQVHYFLIMGRSSGELAVVKGDNLVFTRKIPVTGDDFTKAMTGILVSDRGKTELSLEEAEKIKQEVGIPNEGESRIIGDKISTTQILSMLRAPLEHLVSELGRCFDYYREESGGGKVDSLILFGGGASLGGICSFLSKELGIEVRLGDVLEGLNLDEGAVADKGRISYRLGLAVGAALTEGSGINLLPPEMKEETKRTIRRGTIEAVVTALVLILAFTYIGMKIQLANFQKKIAVSELELAGLKPQLNEAEALCMSGMILADEPYWEDLFRELGNLVPPEIYITNISMKNNVITMKGTVASKDEEKVITNFIISLEKGIFDNVKLVSTRDLENKEAVEFELKCWVDYEK